MVRQHGAQLSVLVGDPAFQLDEAATSFLVKGESVLIPGTAEAAGRGGSDLGLSPALSRLAGKRSMQHGIWQTRDHRLEHQKLDTFAYAG